MLHFGVFTRQDGDLPYLCSCTGGYSPILRPADSAPIPSVFDLYMFPAFWDTATQTCAQNTLGSVTWCLSHDLGEWLKIQFRYCFLKCKNVFLLTKCYTTLPYGRYRRVFLLFRFRALFFGGNFLAIHPEPRNIALVDVKCARSTQQKQVFLLDCAGFAFNSAFFVIMPFR